MIALWMLGAVVTALLAGAAAAAVERALRLWGRQARWAWVAALAASTILPAAALLLPRGLASAVASPVAVAVGPAVRLPAIVTGAGTFPEALGPALSIAWAIASAAALARLALARRALRHTRRRWRPARVDATPVLVAPDTGPLVVGVRSPSVVLPEWALALEAAPRALVVRHESEHARTRDPALLLGAAVAVALAPWNLAVRWQARRLRLAIELDCDARVLRAHPDVASYGRLLLDVARRVASPRPTLAAALLEPTTDLERRITAMRAPRPSRPVALTALLALGATAASLGAFVACGVSDPTAPGLPPDARLQVAEAIPEHAAPRLVGPDDVLFEFQVEEPVVPARDNRGPRYPEALRDARVEGEVLAQFVVDTAGRVVPGTFRVLKSTDQGFTDAVEAAIGETRYVPAKVGGKAVKQLVQQPFAFQLSK